MTKPTQVSISTFAVIALASAVVGFADWRLFAAVAVLGGYWVHMKSVTRFPALLAAGATALGWVVVALGRDIIEGGRVSVKLATFLHLPHAIVTYVVLFLICFVPSLFAALSGKALSGALETQR